MDRLNYTYRDGTNQLWSVQDGIAAGAYAGDIDNQGGSNYSYDRIGNLIGDVSENISQVNWTVYGKIGNIQKKQAFLGYVYNAGGERVVKQYLPYATNQCLGCDENTGLEDLEVYERNSAIPDTFKASKTVTFLSEYTEDERYREYSAIIDAELALCTPQCAARPALASSDADIYIRDATGNVLAVYHYDRKTSQLRWSEQHLYGSSRLGMYLPEKLLTSVSTDSKQREVGYLGKQVFELSNHLGNILATITDKKLQVSLNTTSTAYFEADVQTVQDYYAFGMQMPGRKFTQANISYRFGFNGKENDKDINAGGQDYGARIYDGRLGRWLSVDPLADHPNQVDKSPYSAFWNNPIMYDDPDGQCPFCPWLDAVVDVGFVLYDVGVLIHEKATTGSTSGENWAALGADGASILVPMSVGAGQAVKAGYKALKSADKANDVKKVVTKADDVAEGVIYKRVDKTGKQKDYVGQAKSDKRYDARQKEHKKANPEADYEFTQIDKGKPGKDLNQKEQKHLDKMGGPTNKSNPSGGTSNKKNVIKKN
jgi:RHS repeat-associated protein